MSIEIEQNQAPDDHSSLATHNIILRLPSLDVFLASIKSTPQASSSPSCSSHIERIWWMHLSIPVSNSLHSWSIHTLITFALTTINKNLHSSLRKLSPILFGRTPEYLSTTTNLLEIITLYAAQWGQSFTSHSVNFAILFLKLALTPPNFTYQWAIDTESLISVA